MILISKPRSRRKNELTLLDLSCVLYSAGDMGLSWLAGRAYHACPGNSLRCVYGIEAGGKQVTPKERAEKILDITSHEVLEAAEKCIPYHECQDDLSTCPHMAEWRKSKGVEG